MRFRILGLIGAVAMLSACASTSTPNDGAKTDSSGGDAASSETTATGSLKAVVMEGKPFAMKEGDSFDGWAVDVINAVKDEAGLGSVELTSATSVEEGFDAITSGKADIACGVSFNWQRARDVSYSLPFAIGGTRLLAAAGVDGTPESLNGKTIGVVKDSASAKVLKDVVPNAELTAFNTPAEALEALNGDKVDMIGGPSLWLASNKGDSGKTLVPVRPYGSAGIGCIVKQDNGKLLSTANLAIGQMMQAYVDGDAGSREMVNRWVGPGSTIDLSETTISALYRVMLASTAEISTNVQDPAELAAAEETVKEEAKTDADNAAPAAE